ncbi:hypothetical protein [Streptomyces sp. CAU 1734]|uniref:hypothetical protein n=1 Tax=Streptomyces sp. CAU 1734 TaxID=3140360 RepID=UPI003261CE23
MSSTENTTAGLPGDIITKDTYSPAAPVILRDGVPAKPQQPVGGAGTPEGNGGSGAPVVRDSGSGDPAAEKARKADTAGTDGATGTANGESPVVTTDTYSPAPPILGDPPTAFGDDYSPAPPKP